MRLSHSALLMLAGSLALQASGQTQIQTPWYFVTLAGSSSIGSADGPGASARFNHPTGIVADKAGNLYVADTGNFTVRKIAADGAVSTLAGKAGAAGTADGSGSNARFTYPNSLALDAAGNLFVGDYDLIRKIGPDGKVNTLPPPLDFYGKRDTIMSLAITADGTLYAAAATDGSSFANTLFQVSPAGVVSVDPLFKGNAIGGLTLDGSGRVYYSDPLLSAIYALWGPGLLAGTPGARGYTDGPGASASFSYPLGLATAPNGTLYVADNNNNLIRAISPAGQVTTLAGVPQALGSADGPGTTAIIPFPVGVTVGQAGTVYVTNDNTVRKITPAGDVATLAGLSRFQKSGADGKGANARFQQPTGLAMDEWGDLYVADAGNFTVRKVTPQGVVSTLAGAAGIAGYVDGPAATSRLTAPRDVTADARGNVYVLDGTVVRKITPDGVVSTLAGQQGKGGYVDGPTSQALFVTPLCLTADAIGNVYVGEVGSIALNPNPYPGATTARVRRISTDGQVTTVDALTAYLYPHTYPTGMTVDAAGNLYVCDNAYSHLLRLAPDGVVTPFDFGGQVFSPYSVAISKNKTVYMIDGVYRNRVGVLLPDGSVGSLGGKMGVFSNADGVGEDALFSALTDIVIDSVGTVYVTDESSNTIRKGVLARAPIIGSQPENQSVLTGGTAQFIVSAAAIPAPTYQWYLNGVALDGQTASTLTLAKVQPANAGNYSVVVSNQLGTVTSAAAALTVVPITPPAAPAPAAGGGGAPSPAFLGVLAILATLRRRRLPA